jgi:hypothetical protein
MPASRIPAASATQTTKVQLMASSSGLALLRTCATIFSVLVGVRQQSPKRSHPSGTGVLPSLLVEPQRSFMPAASQASLGGRGDADGIASNRSLGAFCNSHEQEQDQTLQLKAPTQRHAVWRTLSAQSSARHHAAACEASCQCDGCGPPSTQQQTSYSAIVVSASIRR